MALSSNKDIWQTIESDDNLDNVKKQAFQQRHGNWRVQFSGLTIYCRDLLSFYMAAKDIFLRKIYSFETSKQTPVIIDGGGHIGLFTLFAKQKYPNAQITTFEPDEVSQLLLNLNLNANNAGNVGIVKAGLYTRNGKLSFGTDNSDGSSIYAEQKTTIINVVKLSDFVETEIDFLKLNIEGAELGVLEELGQKLRLVKELVIEYHGFPEIGQKLHKILEILDHAGFRYLIHDFDNETNSITKPPFHLGANTRIFLLIYARQLFEHKTVPAGNAPVNESMRLQPVSRLFGFDRGDPVDRHYIQKFLNNNRALITGRVLEIGDNEYTKKYGTNVAQSDVLNREPSSNATIVGDMAKGQNIPESAFDCVIMTQTIQMIYDVKSALRNAYASLKPGGSLLITASGISQISRYDMDRWGEFWRFTDKSLKSILDEIAIKADITVESYGNVAVAKAFLDGLALQEIAPETLEYNDNDYQVTLAARVCKPKTNIEYKTDQYGNLSINIIKKPSSAENKPIEVSETANIATDSNVSFKTPLILLYHRIADDPVDAQLLAVSPDNFEAHVKELVNNYRVLPLRQLLIEAEFGKLSPDTVALTFDDGYLDVLENGVPILEKYGAHATVFIVSEADKAGHEYWWDAMERIFFSKSDLPDTLRVEFTKGDKIWNMGNPNDRLEAHDELCDVIRSQPVNAIRQIIEGLLAWAEMDNCCLKKHKVVNTEQLNRLASSASIEIGSHAATHARLSALPEDEQRMEIRTSKQQLESKINRSVRIFSYPFGSYNDFTEKTAQLVAQEGYSAGIANVQANVTAPVDMFSIPRRLVRNWNGALFAKWLKDPDKNRLENQTLAGRAAMLKELAQANGAGSR